VGTEQPPEVHFSFEGQGKSREKHITWRSFWGTILTGTAWMDIQVAWCLTYPSLSGMETPCNVGRYAVKKKLLRICGPDLIRINSLIKTRHSAVFKKPRAQRGTFFGGVRREIFNLTLAALRRKHFCFFWRYVWLLNSLQKRCFSHKNSLASCQRCRHSVEPRALPCTFKQINLSAWSCQNL